MEKNVILTAKRGNEVVVIRPYTSVYNVKGLTDYLNNIIDYVKDNFVQKETGKGLSTNDFTDEDKTKLDSLADSSVTEIRIGGTTITPDDGVIDLTNNVVSKETDVISDSEITDIFNSKGEING